MQEDNCNHLTGRVRTLVNTWAQRSADGLAAFALVLLFSLVPGQSRADVTLVFGTYAADKPTATVKKYKPFLTFLASRMSERLGEPVDIRMKISKTYEDGIAQLANGDVDFARFGPASYVAVTEMNTEVKIVAMESKKGEKRFKGVIAVHENSEFNSLADLKGHSFAFGDELSTIGRYLAQSHLLNAGVSAANLSGFSFLGRHDLVGEAVGAGKFDAGALKESTYKKLVQKGVPLRVLFDFDNVTKPWLAHPKVPDRVRQAMQDVMLAEKNDERVREISKNGFLAGTDEDYQLVRDAMQHSASF